MATSGAFVGEPAIPRQDPSKKDTGSVRPVTGESLFYDAGAEARDPGAPSVTSLGADDGANAAEVLVDVIDQDPLDDLLRRHRRHAGEDAAAPVELGV